MDFFNVAIHKTNFFRLFFFVKNYIHRDIPMKFSLEWKVTVFAFLQLSTDFLSKLDTFWSIWDEAVK